MQELYDFLIFTLGWFFELIKNYPKTTYTLFAGHITTIAVTIYLHRCETHCSVTLASPVKHFLRFWLWMRTGINTHEWVCVHRKHHRFVDQSGDPHSPKKEGIFHILFGGVWYYQKECRNVETQNVYALPTLPKDWMEQHVYASFKSLGLFILLAIELLIFGWWGFVTWLIQMLWIPFFAAGVLNGLGHYFGYRNYETKDASRNIHVFAWMPTLFFIFTGGEEYHNNHHRNINSPKFSARWWEFDVGWLYLRILEYLGLASLKEERMPR